MHTSEIKERLLKSSQWENSLASADICSLYEECRFFWLRLKFPAKIISRISWKFEKVRRMVIAVPALPTLGKKFTCYDLYCKGINSFNCDEGNFYDSSSSHIKAVALSKLDRCIFPCVCKHTRSICSVIKRSKGSILGIVSCFLSRAIFIDIRHLYK